MLINLIRKEVVSHILSLRFGVTFVLFLVLIFASMYVTVNYYHLEIDAYSIREQEDKNLTNTLLDIDDTSVLFNRFFYHEGMDNAVRISPLGWLGEGFLEVCPDTIKVRATMRSRNVDQDSAFNPLTSLMRTPDFYYVINVMLSLLAILFVFDAICGEKETGTLRLMLSNAVPRHLVLLGKWIGGYLVLFTPFCLAVAGGLAYATSTGAVKWDSETVQRIFLLLLTAGLYISVFFNIGLFVSTSTNRSATSLLICLLIWVTCIIVIPNLAPVTARIISPTPSLKSVQESKAVIDEETRLQRNILQQVYGEIDYSNATDSEIELLENKANRMKNRLDKAYEDSVQEQKNLAVTLGRLSPSSCWMYSATALTNTGLLSYQKFLEARDKLADNFDELMQYARRSRWEVWRAQNNADSLKTWSESIKARLPHFEMNYPSFTDSINDALNDILILLILNVIFFMLAFTFFLRYDVR
ncbi:MAG: ABC transporter permease subunit [Planctomycetes bacterium]|nr:ABC transporter permease subunit [Planctomycetota bacterium]